MDERDWIQRIVAGDTQSFSCLVAKYEKMAYTIALRIVGNQEDAEEVVQDAFLKMYRALPSFAGESKFSSWFYRIVYRTALDTLRGRKLFEDYEEIGQTDVSLAEQETASGVLERKDRKEIIGEVMKRLPASESLILTLYYLEECSVEEIRKITDLSETNIKTRLFRSRKHFYEQLEKYLKNELNTLHYDQ